MAGEFKVDHRVSVIVVVGERFDPLDRIISDYDRVLKTVLENYRFTVVLDGDRSKASEQLKNLESSDVALSIVQLSQRFGETAALSVGFKHTDGELVLTLPAYYQIEPEALPELIRSLADEDMVIGRRWPRRDSLWNKFGTSVFRKLVSLITGHTYRDLGCEVRFLRRAVADEVAIYGDQHRFFPILANYHGFDVREVSLPQSKNDPRVRVYRPSVYAQRLLDLMVVFFLVKFTRKPLRFFGAIGGTIFTLGSAALIVIVYQRLFLSVGLGDRPALLLSTLLIVLGAQLVGLGLIGELIIFTHARELKDYAIKETINMEPGSDR